MINAGCWWYRGGVASLALTAWMASESFCQAQSLRPTQPNPQPTPRTSGNGVSGNRAIATPGSIGAFSSVSNYGGFSGNIGGVYKVPSSTRMSVMVPGVGNVTTGFNPWNPNSPIVGSVPYNSFNPYVNPYQSPYVNPYSAYNPYLSPYSPYALSPYQYSPYSAYSPYALSPYQYSTYSAYPLSPYQPSLGAYSGFYNQFNPYGLNQTGNPFGNFGAYDPFGNAFGGGMVYGGARPY
jgi:hypothetical protein